MKNFPSCLLLVTLILLAVIQFPQIGNAITNDNIVYIRADGTIEPSTPLIQRAENTYTLKGNLEASIIIEKDGIVFDGAGYNLTGTAADENNGIDLSYRNNVVVKNVQIKHCGSAILLQNSTRNAIIGADIRNSSFAIRLKNSSGNSITDCTIADNLCGIQQDWCSGNILSRNNITGTISRAVLLSYSSSSTISSNRIIGKQSPISISEGIEVGMSSSNNTVSNNYITQNAFAGIKLQNAQNTTISNNLVVDNPFTGISIASSTGTIVTSNNVTGSIQSDGGFGFSLSSSSGSVLRNNNAYNNSKNLQIGGYSPNEWNHDIDSSNKVEGKPVYYWVEQHGRTLPSEAGYVVLVNCTDVTVQGLAFVNKGQGLLLVYSTYCAITQNTFANNCSLVFSSSSANSVTENAFTNNDCGIYVQHNSFNNIISANLFTGNNLGVSMSASSSNTLTANNFTGNNIALSFSSASSNNIFLNNLQNNTRAVNDNGMNNFYGSVSAAISTQSVSVRVLTFLSTSVVPANFIGPPPLSANNWDDGVRGNFWSEYNGTDANGDGVGDTPYYLYGNNQDNYPLMSPSNISVLPAPPPSASPSLSPEPALSSSPTLVTPQPTLMPTPTAYTTQQVEDFSSILIICASIALVVAAVAVLFYFERKKG